MLRHSRIFQNGFRVGMRFMQQRQLVKKMTFFEYMLQQNSKVSSSSRAYLQSMPKMTNNETCKLIEASKGENVLNVTFKDNTKGMVPFVWLRENCQCSTCFDNASMGRNLLMQNIYLDPKPKEVEFEEDVLKITWTDHHTSIFYSEWIYQRAFNSQARENYRSFYSLQKVTWGKNFVLDKFDYKDLITKDEDLLKWLTTLEVKGVALVQNIPDDTDAGPKLCDHVGYAKQTHFGRSARVIVREVSNNLAYSSKTLGLHLDLPFYKYQPGLILLHTLKQHKKEGGDSIFSDGFYAAKILRKNNPKEFDILTKTNVYFWDKGVATMPLEKNKFYKISRLPTIGLDNEGNVEIIRVNNQVRDSHLDLPPNQVHLFYEAMKIFTKILYDNSHTMKMQDGELLIMDNVRCLHGRDGFESTSSRHLETSYLDWDEALCSRRILQQELGYVKIIV